MAASGNRKRPHFIHRRDGAPIGLAGLAETWIGPNGEELDTVAIVTRGRQRRSRGVVHACPWTVSPGDFDRWLDCSTTVRKDVMAAPDRRRRRRVRLARGLHAGQPRRQ